MALTAGHSFPSYRLEQTHSLAAESFHLLCLTSALNWQRFERTPPSAFPIRGWKLGQSVCSDWPSRKAGGTWPDTNKDADPSLRRLTYTPHVVFLLITATWRKAPNLTPANPIPLTICPRSYSWGLGIPWGTDNLPSWRDGALYDSLLRQPYVFQPLYVSLDTPILNHSLYHARYWIYTE